MSLRVPEWAEKYRLRTGIMGSSLYNDGNNGVFEIPVKSTRQVLRVIIHDGITGERTGWEHVSVSHRRRIPIWEEMSEIKQIFWEDEDCVVEFHPPKSNYVNRTWNVLHLWRSIESQFPQPDRILV